jgi:hypothetical protein
MSMRGHLGIFASAEARTAAHDHGSDRERPPSRPGSQTPLVSCSKGSRLTRDSPHLAWAARFTGAPLEQVI